MLAYNAPELSSAGILVKTPEWIFVDDAYEFDDWYYNAEFKGSPVTGIAAGETGVKTLYAKWIPHEYTIKLLVGRGD